MEKNVTVKIPISDETASIIEIIKDELERSLAQSIVETYAEEEFKILYGDGTSRQPRGIIESNLTTTE